MSKSWQMTGIVFSREIAQTRFFFRFNLILCQAESLGLLKICDGLHAEAPKRKQNANKIKKFLQKNTIIT